MSEWSPKPKQDGPHWRFNLNRKIYEPDEMEVVNVFDVNAEHWFWNLRNDKHGFLFQPIKEKPPEPPWIDKYNKLANLYSFVRASRGREILVTACSFAWEFHIYEGRRCVKYSGNIFENSKDAKKAADAAEKTFDEPFDLEKNTL